MMGIFMSNAEEARKRYLNGEQVPDDESGRESLAAKLEALQAKFFSKATAAGMAEDQLVSVTPDQMIVALDNIAKVEYVVDSVQIVKKSGVSNKKLSFFRLVIGQLPDSGDSTTSE